MLAIGGPTLEALIPLLDHRKGWPLDLQLEITIKRRACGNVGKRENFSTQERPIREHSFEQSEVLSTARNLVADGCPITQMLGCSVKSPEHAHQKVRLERRLRPVHPAVGLRSRTGVRGPKLA